VILAQRLQRTRDMELWAWFVQTAEGPLPPPTFNDNGCSASPDYMLVTREAIWPACRAHDWHYSGLHGDPELTRTMADDWFAENIYVCIRYQQMARETGWRVLLRPVNAVRARYYAEGYARAVRRFGGRHFRPAAVEIA
jgi:hypothetical protein